MWHMVGLALMVVHKLLFLIFQKLLTVVVLLGRCGSCMKKQKIDSSGAKNDEDTVGKIDNSSILSVNRHTFQWSYAYLQDKHKAKR